MNTGATALRPLGVAERLALDARYAPSFQAAFGDPKPTSKRMVESIAAFVATLHTGRNAADEALAGSRTALSPAASRGLELFREKAACATCHVLDRGEDGRALLTDGLHHNTGVAAAQAAAGKAAIQEHISGKRKRSKSGAVVDTLVVRDGVVMRFGDDQGRAGATGEKSQTGAFKTPSLRDVARRAPYMHDGSLATLEEVVRYYAKGGTPNAHLDAAIKPVALTDQEVADLVAFLESLSGKERPGVLPARPEERQIRVRVLDVDGNPVPHLAVEVMPFGENLGKGSAALRTATTASDGSISITFPQTTHVVLNAAGWELAGGRPIPDTSGDLDVVAAPLDRITVLVRGAKLPAELEGTITSNTAFAVVADEAGMVFEMDGRFARGRQAETDPEKFVFTRLRVMDAGSALYTAPLGRTRTRARLNFPGTEENSLRTAAIDLDGGWSEPVQLLRVQSASVNK
jgi:mono/diheme cytochrome c family protein